MIDKTIAKILLETKAVSLNVKEPFTFASGIKSPIYCDNRYLLGFPHERNIIINAFCDIELIKSAEVIVGTATAGIAWAAIIAQHLQKPMAYVRGESKGHGKGKVIEGAEVQGKKVIIIEDLISTGGSSKKVLDNLIEAEAEVMGIIAIFSYEFEQSKVVFGSYPCIALSNFSSLITIAEETSYLTKEDCKIALSWNKSPDTWLK